MRSFPLWTYGAAVCNGKKRERAAAAVAPVLGVEPPAQLREGALEARVDGLDGHPEAQRDGARTIDEGREAHRRRDDEQDAPTQGRDEVAEEAQLVSR